MKRILFSLLLWAGFAIANTCTEAWFEVHNFSFLYKKDAIHIDSIYYKEYDNDWSSKYIYKNNQLESIVFNLDRSTEIVSVYISKDESVLVEMGEELLISDSTAGDTSYFTQKVFRDGKLVQDIIHKNAGLYSSELSYNPGGNKYDFTELFFRNDTLVLRFIDNYYTDSPEESFTYYVEDSTDDLTCYEYKDDPSSNESENPSTPKYTLTYHKNSQGYSLKYFDKKYLSEYFMVYPNATTAIRKQRPAVKISPKARYFDLLGRYRFTR